jgi:hypothetical protein
MSVRGLHVTLSNLTTPPEHMHTAAIVDACNHLSVTGGCQQAAVAESEFFLHIRLRCVRRLPEGLHALRAHPRGTHF